MVQVFDTAEHSSRSSSSAGCTGHTTANSSRVAGPSSLPHGVFQWLSSSESSLRNAVVPIVESLQSQGLCVAKSGPAVEAISVCVSTGIVLLLLWTVLALKSITVDPIAAFCTEEGCHPGTGQVLCFFYSIGHLLDPPDSVREVAGSVLLLLLIHRLAALMLFTVNQKVGFATLHQFESPPWPPAYRHLAHLIIQGGHRPLNASLSRHRSSCIAV